MKKMLAALLCATAALYGAQLRDFKPLDAASGSKRIYSFAFEEKKPVRGFIMPKSYTWKWGNGENGNGGLALSRKATDKYEFARIRLAKLKPGVRYKVSAMVTVDGAAFKDGKPLNKKMHCIGVDISKAGKNGKYIHSVYKDVKLVNGKLPWTEVSFTFTLPDDAVASLCFFAKVVGHAPGCKQVAWDNVTVTAEGEEAPLVYPVFPKHLRLKKDDVLSMRVYNFNRKGKELAVFATLPDKREFYSAVKDDCATFKFGELPAGCHNIAFHVADLKSKRIVAEDSYPFTVTSKPDPAGTVTTTRDGRTFIDGKPYFPIGIFVEGSTVTPKMMQDMRDWGIKFIIPYRNFKMRLPQPQSDKPTSVAELRRSLDVLHKNGLKLCFCATEVAGRLGSIDSFEGITDKIEILRHVARGLSDHPGLFGWYISDENPVDQLGFIRKMRYAVSTNDPYHPVATLTNRPSNFPYFAPTGDVMMLDKYPIYSDEDQSVESIITGLELEHNTSDLGTWWVPQIFNWGIYHIRPWKYEEYRYPTELEMKSQSVVALNHGARSVVFYAYNSIKKHDKYEPGASVWFGERVANAIKFTAALEPYFVTDKAPKVLKVTSAGQSPVSAKLHTALDGKQIVAIESVGPGKADATINVGKAGLKSKLGFTKEISKGVYRFESANISSDILE